MSAWKLVEVDEPQERESEFSIGVRKVGGFDPLWRWEAVILYRGVKQNYVGTYATRWGAIRAARLELEKKLTPVEELYEEIRL